MDRPHPVGRRAPDRSLWPLLPLIVLLALANSFAEGVAYGNAVLGWFPARAMFETRGFLAPWFIHILQDVVIFSTIVLLDNY